MLKRVWFYFAYFLSVSIHTINIVSIIGYMLVNIFKQNEARVLLDTNGEIMMSSYQSYNLLRMILFSTIVILVSFKYYGRTKGFRYIHDKSFRLLLFFTCVISTITCLAILILSTEKYFFFVEVLLSIFHVLITMVIYDRTKFLKSIMGQFSRNGN